MGDFSLEHPYVTRHIGKRMQTAEAIAFILVVDDQAFVVKLDAFPGRRPEPPLKSRNNSTACSQKISADGSLSLVDEIFVLPMGHFLTVDAVGGKLNVDPTKEIDECYEACLMDRDHISWSLMISQLKRHLARDLSTLQASVLCLV